MIEDVFDYVVQDFTDSGCPAVVQFGAEFVAEHNEPPRVVFVPGEDTYGPPNYVQAASTSPGGGQNPRPIATRYEGATLYIWAGASLNPDGTQQLRDDYAALGALINQTVLSIHRANPGNYTIGRGRNINKPTAVRRGLVYELDITVQVPIVDIPYTAAGVTTDSTTYDTTHADPAITVETDFPDNTSVTIGPF